MLRAERSLLRGRRFRGSGDRPGGWLPPGLDDYLHKDAAGATVTVDVENVFVPAHPRCVDREGEFVTFKMEPQPLRLARRPRVQAPAARVTEPDPALGRLTAVSDPPEINRRG